MAYIAGDTSTLCQLFGYILLGAGKSSRRDASCRQSSVWETGELLKPLRYLARGLS